MIETVLKTMVTREAITLLTATATTWNLANLLARKKIAVLTEPLKTLGPMVGVVAGIWMMECSKDSFWPVILGSCLSWITIEVCSNLCEGDELSQGTLFWMTSGVTAYNAVQLYNK